MRGREGAAERLEIGFAQVGLEEGLAGPEVAARRCSLLVRRRFVERLGRSMRVKEVCFTCEADASSLFCGCGLLKFAGRGVGVLVNEEVLDETLEF